jgi:hypothetical protein
MQNLNKNEVDLLLLVFISKNSGGNLSSNLVHHLGQCTRLG